MARKFPSAKHRQELAYIIEKQRQRRLKFRGRPSPSLYELVVVVCLGVLAMQGLRKMLSHVYDTEIPPNYMRVCEEATCDAWGAVRGDLVLVDAGEGVLGRLPWAGLPWAWLGRAGMFPFMIVYQAVTVWALRGVQHGLLRRVPDTRWTVVHSKTCVRCAVCGHVLYDPVLVPGCGQHVFCRRCLASEAPTPAAGCPGCGQAVGGDAATLPQLAAMRRHVMRHVPRAQRVKRAETHATAAPRDDAPPAVPVMLSLEIAGVPVVLLGVVQLVVWLCGDILVWYWDAWVRPLLGDWAAWVASWWW